MINNIIKNETTKAIQVLDDELSKRFIELDPSGYFLIKLNQLTKELVVEHYTNDIDDAGLATDPDTGKPIDCSNSVMRTPTKIFKGRSAKEIGIKITEGSGPIPLSRFDHALYLGRELQKAEECLLTATPYVQD